MALKSTHRVIFRRYRIRRRQRFELKVYSSFHEVDNQSRRSAQLLLCLPSIAKHIGGNDKIDIVVCRGIGREPTETRASISGNPGYFGVDTECHPARDKYDEGL